MREFPVDDDLVALIWQRADPRPFEQLSFSEALRRVLKLPRSPLEDPRRRAPKADLHELVRLGVLRESQELFLLGYQRNRVGPYKATISGGRLLFKGQLSSMSTHARDLLKKEGFSSDSVRGPEHWATSDGTRVCDLWEQVLGARRASHLATPPLTPPTNVT